MNPLDAKAFVFPDFTGQKALVLGLGGGCDIITAFALSTLLGGRVVYANTKVDNVGPVEKITAHIVRVSGPQLDPAHRVRGYGRARIDHSVPRGPDGCPWIVLLGDEAAERELPGEIRSLGFDVLIGVDTGGDSIARKGGRGHRGRDQRMLRLLLQTGLPVLHVVVAPGSDGEAAYEDLRAEFTSHAEQGRYAGCFSLEPILPILRSHSPSLSPTRTPRIILAAVEDQLVHGRDGKVIVPRGRKPAVPRAWLLTGFVFTPAG
jgi:hypothetical protein